MSHGARLLAGLALVGFGLVLALGAVEIYVRAFHLVPDRFWQPNPVLGRRLIAGKSGWWTQEDREFVVPVRINAAGRRDLDRAIAKPAGTFRILLLGDSFVEAMQVPIDATFARQLESILNARGGPPVEVLSMGVSGYGTASELLYYLREGRAYRPDLVMLAFYAGNDVRNNSPLLEVDLIPAYDASGAIDRVSSRKGDGKEPRGWLRSEAYAYFRKLILTRHPAVAERLADWGLLDRAALRKAPLLDGVPVDYWVYAAVSPPEWQEAWRYTERLLGDLRDAVAADGAQLVVLVVTARERVYPDDWQRVLATYPAMTGVEWDLTGPERRTLAWCADAGVSCMALSEAFLERSGRPPRLHFEHDGHWTPAGHALAANIVANFLRATGWPPARPVEG